MLIRSNYVDHGFKRRIINIMWQNKPRPNKTARVPYAYIPSEDDPLVLIPDPEVVRWVEDALDHLDEGHSSRRVAACLVEKTGKKISDQTITYI